MKQMNMKQKKAIVVAAMTLGSIAVLSIYVVTSVSEKQTVIDNLAICLQDFPKDERELCFDWLQAFTANSAAIPLTLIPITIPYILYRITDSTQRDNLVNRLVEQCKRLQKERPTYIPLVLDNGSVGALVAHCQCLYDNYISNVLAYNNEAHDIKSVRIAARELSKELEKNYHI